MITCIVCGRENDDLSTVCADCKSFLQSRVDALNLFSTMWGLIESPSATFKRIILARHKNYVVVLGMLFGVALVLDVSWYLKLGSRFAGLGGILGISLVAGPLLGVLSLWAGAFLLRMLTKPLGGIATMRNMLAALSYATMPMVLALVFLVPIELAIFGRDFFGVNPPPSIVKPTEYFTILVLKGIVFSYWFVLTVWGVMAANAFGKEKAIPVTLLVFGVGAMLAIGMNSVPVPTR